MKRESSSGEQLDLGFRPLQGLPFAVSARVIGRAVRRSIRASASAKFGIVRYFEQVETLRQLRGQYRRELREVRRRGKSGSAAAFATTPEGRRLHRVVHGLSEQIATEHASLCG